MNYFKLSTEAIRTINKNGLLNVVKMRANGEKSEYKILNGTCEGS